MEPKKSTKHKSLLLKRDIYLLNYSNYHNARNLSTQLANLNSTGKLPLPLPTDPAGGALLDDSILLIS